MSLQVLSVASEVYPLIKTGGLADVAGALPGAVAPHGVEVRTLVPAYPQVLAAVAKAEAIHTWPDLFGGEARLLAGKAGGLDILAIDAPHLFSREGNPYLASNGTDWPDNAFRFAALGRVAADIGHGLVPAIVPDVIHGHDWQAGLTFAYLHYDRGRRPGTVFTIHNMAFPGQFPASLLGALGFGLEAMTVDGIEYFNTISYLKAGLRFADHITTVSPTYAAEIMTPENGMGFDGLLRTRAAVLSGVRNGIDEVVWNPAKDAAIAATYTASTIKARAPNKQALQAKLGLDEDPAALLFGVVSRLSVQKGLDLLLEAIPTLVELGGQLAVLGSGDKWHEDGFRNATAFHPGAVGVQLGYDESLAHLIQAGADALLVPSRFEPCGLTPVTLEALETALRRTAAVYKDKEDWAGMIKAGMATDVSWRRPAKVMARLYRELAGASAQAA